MSSVTLAVFIAVAWLIYPVAGTLQVEVYKTEGKRPADAGFSFLPELIVFPLLFFGIAWLIDRVVEPWGSWFVAGVSTAMIVAGIISVCLVLKTLRQAKREQAERDYEKPNGESFP